MWVTGKTTWSEPFLNGLVGSLTFGIYTPTSTVYYVPLKDIAPTHSVDVRNNEIIDLIEE